MSEIDLFRLQAELYQALNAADDAKVRALGLQVAQNASGDFPLFNEILNALGFHNQIVLINEMMAAAWRQAQNTPAFSRPAVEAYAARATDHLIYAFLEEDPHAAQPSQSLIERIEEYFAVEPQRLQSYLDLLSGRKGYQWSEADFEPLEMPALSGIMVEFLGHASQLDVPLARSHLFRDIMPRYLLDRQAGNLQPREDVASVLRQTARPFPNIPPPPLHKLVPDKPSLLLFMQRLLQTAYPQPHSAATLLLLSSQWVDFLVFRRLISEDIAQKTVAFLPELQQSLAPLWRDQADKALRALA